MNRPAACVDHGHRRGLLAAQCPITRVGRVVVQRDLFLGLRAPQPKLRSVGWIVGSVPCHTLNPRHVL